MGQQGEGKDVLANHTELKDKSLAEGVGQEAAEGNRTLIL